MRRPTAIRPRRSVLYMPGSNARALEKARTLAADAVVLDLEDAVAPETKVEARERIAAVLAKGGFGRREVVVRINALASPWGADDIARLAGGGADALLVPKVESAADIARLEQALASAPAALSLWAMIETPRAILEVGGIAATAAKPGARLAAFVIGTNDLVKETRATLEQGRFAALYWLSATVTAARAYGLDVLDGVYNDFKDLTGFETECQQGRIFGMDGKTLIHPSQIEGANAAFSPAEAEVAWARRILAEFAKPEAKGRGVITIDGRMVELLHAEMAARTVAIADAIAAASAG